jgi:hypothetical protein
MSIHDVVSIDAKKQIFPSADGSPRYVTIFVIKGTKGKIELHAFSEENIIIEFKETEVLE